MRILKLLVLLFAISFPSLSYFADAANRKNTVPNGTIIILGQGNKLPNGRPNMPSRQIISCTYDSGELTIDFTVPEGMCEVLLTETSGIAMSYTVDSSDLTATVYVGTISESEIEITTESGNTYSGVLTSEE